MNKSDRDSIRGLVDDLCIAWTNWGKAHPNSYYNFEQFEQFIGNGYLDVIRDGADEETRRRIDMLIGPYSAAIVRAWIIRNKTFEVKPPWA